MGKIVEEEWRYSLPVTADYVMGIKGPTQRMSS